MKDYNANLNEVQDTNQLIKNVKNDIKDSLTDFMNMLKTDLKIAQLVRTIPVKHKEINCFLLPLVTSFFYLIHANKANILSIDIEGDHDVISITFVIDERLMKLVVSNLELHRVADSFEKLKEECGDEF